MFNFSVALGDSKISILESLKNLWESTGLSALNQTDTLLNLIMMVIAGLLLFLAISKKFEPNLLLAMAFGMFIINIPGAYAVLYGTKGIAPIIDMTSGNLISSDQINALIANGVLNTNFELIFNGEVLQGTLTQISQIFEMGDVTGKTDAQILQLILSNDAFTSSLSQAGVTVEQLVGSLKLDHKVVSDFGLLYYLYKGVDWVIFPPLIFLGIGAMTDFGPLIANPKSLLLGAAAQIGIFVTFILASLVGFTGAQAAAIGIIGGADGPTAIYLTSKLANELMSSIAIAAYSYMALVPVIQPPIMKLLTTKKERMIVMEQLRPVSKREKILFPIIVTGVVGIILPSAIPLLGMLMLGNLMKESGVVPRLEATARNELINIITIFLGITVGSKAYGSQFLNVQTILIIILGVLAFAIATAGGVLVGKLMCKLSGGKINPLIGSAGVSAVPMAARVSQDVGRKENPNNYLLMHAMGPNVAGVIGSAVAAGALLAIFG